MEVVYFMNSEFITVCDAKGRPTELEIVDVLEIDAKKYVIAGPKDSEEVCAYKVTSRNEKEIEYQALGMGREFDKVLKAYNSHN